MATLIQVTQSHLDTMTKYFFFQPYQKGEKNKNLKNIFNVNQALKGFELQGEKKLFCTSHFPFSHTFSPGSNCQGRGLQILNTMWGEGFKYNESSNFIKFKIIFL